MKPKSTQALSEKLYRLRKAEERDAQVKKSKRDWSGPAVIPKGLKVQKAPKPVDRFAVTGPIVGGFKTMGIGRYL